MHRVSLTRTSQALILGALALFVATVAAQLLVGSSTAPLLRTEVLGVQLEPVTPGARIVESESETPSEVSVGLDLSVLADMAPNGSTTAEVTATTSAPQTTAPATTSPATTSPATTSPATTVLPTTVPATTVPETTIPSQNVPVSLPKPDLTGIGTADAGGRCEGGEIERLAASVLFSGDELAGIGDSRFGHLVPFLFDCGDYVATLVSRDVGHIDPASVATSQDNERWLIEFFDADGVSLGASAPAEDLPDDAVVGTTQLLLRVPEGTTQIRPVHIGTDVDKPYVVVALGIVLSSPSLVQACGFPTTLDLSPNQGGSVSAACAEYVAVLVGDASATATVSVEDGVASVSHTARDVSAVVLVPVRT